MNKATFLTLVRQASRISDQNVEELEKLVVNFPYCQSAHLLIAKAAYDKGSMLSNQKLKKAAIYAANRQLLKKLIYTSDATVALHPVEPEQTISEIPEMPVLTDEAIIQEEIAEQVEIPVESIPEEAPAVAEIEEEEPVIPEPETHQEEELPEIEVPAEEPVISEEIAEDFQPEAEPEILEAATPVSEVSEENITGIHFETEPEAEIEPEVEVEQTLSETSEQIGHFIEEPAESLAIIEDVHELLLEDAPEILAETESINAAHHDEMLHDTLASFDQYLFRPEKEPEVPVETEDLKVVYPENVIQTIFNEDSIGYWMSSSRLGECLDMKSELTTKAPVEFHPELILEYSKTHELQKEIKPAASNLSRQLELIDDFLKMTPRLKNMANTKIKTESQEDLSTKSSKINKSLATESYANILVKQGKNKKAIKIYEHLILKIPEKKAYFVAQIEKLQNLE